MGIDEALTNKFTCPEMVYLQMHGLFGDEQIPGVKDESEQGEIGAAYDKLSTALETLCSRFAISFEDPDIPDVLLGAEKLCQASSLNMFDYDAAWARQNPKK